MLPSMQLGEQLVGTQFDERHSSLTAHAFPHWPQWSCVEVRSKQPPAVLPAAGQQVSVAEQARPAPGHTHAPETHCSLGLHCLPQAPQFIVSVCVLWQPSGQQVCPLVQVEPPQLHTPATHFSLAAQA
jgi:hypothetical protein